MRTACALLFALACHAQTKSITVSGNFPGDLFGPIDSRMAGQLCAGSPCIWGHADYAVLPIKFHPPNGMKVHILALRGDLVAWVKTFAGDPPTIAESTAGVLASFQTSTSLTASKGASGLQASVNCDYCSDGAPLYIQGAVSEKQPSIRAPFDYQDVDILLDSDNLLNAKIAAWLNNTGKPIHVELTYTIKFRYE